MPFKPGALSALLLGTFLISSGQALAAAPDAADYVGKRLKVDVQQLLYYEDPAKSYIASLQRGQSFEVRRISPSGTYAYGFAYGRVNRVGC